MNNDVNLSNIPDYVSIKEAAEMLGLSANRTYELVTEGRLNGVRAADVIMIPLGEVEQFKRRATGRPRRNHPKWRISPGADVQLTTLILVPLQEGKQDMLAQKLAEIKRQNTHIFPGTIARYMIMSDTVPSQVQILLIWKNATMPDEGDLNRELSAFRRELADVLDWDSAQYNHGKVFMHT